MRRTVPLAGVLAVALVLSLTTTAFAGPRLSVARYKAIDKELTAEISLDKSSASPVIAKVERVCKAMNPKDKLLKPIGSACTAGTAILRRTLVFNSCAGPTNCMAATKSLRTGAETLVKRLRAMNTAVNRNVSAGTCRNSLRATNNEFNEATLLIKSMKSFEHALNTKQQSDAKIAQDQLKAAQALARRDPSAATQRARFRKACK